MKLIINFLLRYISSSFYSVNNRIRIYIIAIGLKRCGILFLEIFLGFIIVFIVIALFVYCLRIFVSIWPFVLAAVIAIVLFIENLYNNNKGAGCNYIFAYTLFKADWINLHWAFTAKIIACYLFNWFSTGYGDCRILFLCIACFYAVLLFITSEFICYRAFELKNELLKFLKNFMEVDLYKFGCRLTFTSYYNAGYYDRDSSKNSSEVNNTENNNNVNNSKVNNSNEDTDVKFIAYDLLEFYWLTFYYKWFDRNARLRSDANNANENELEQDNVEDINVDSSNLSSNNINVGNSSGGLDSRNLFGSRIGGKSDYKSAYSCMRSYSTSSLGKNNSKVDKDNSNVEKGFILIDSSDSSGNVVDSIEKLDIDKVSSINSGINLDTNVDNDSISLDNTDFSDIDLGLSVGKDIIGSGISDDIIMSGELDNVQAKIDRVLGSTGDMITSIEDMEGVDNIPLNRGKTLERF